MKNLFFDIISDRLKVPQLETFILENIQVWNYEYTCASKEREMVHGGGDWLEVRTFREYFSWFHNVGHDVADYDDGDGVADDQT